jgi:hypothetical protein
MTRRRWTGLAALGVYCAVSFLYFGLRLLIESGRQYVGPFDDPQIVIWAFGWFPHAILHGENPLVTPTLWAPVGINLTWSTTVPGLSLLVAPLTLLIGPFATYNVVTILMPALAAWTAFLLCRHLTGSFWPSFVGGYLFGFSSYMFGHLQGHVHMTSVFLVPLVALVVLRYIEAELSGHGLVVRLGPLLALQLLFSTELIFTLTLALSGALLLAMAIVPDRRQRLVSSIGPLVAAYAVAGVLTSPFLYYAARGLHTAAYVPPQQYVADLLNFVIPTKLELAGNGWAHAIAKHFQGNDTENGAFLGPPALVIVAWFAWRRLRTTGGRFLVAAFALTVFFALGSELHVAGHRVLPLPWIVVIHQPLWDNVLTVRFAMYISLLLGVIVALWTASRPAGSTLRWLLPGVAMLALVPNPWAKTWATTYTIPHFFTDSAYRSCLRPNEIILPEPISVGGESMLWQVANGFHFRMAGGRIQQVPPSPFMHPDTIALISGGYDLRPGQSGLLRAYIQAKGVTTVVVDKNRSRRWTPVLDRIARRRDVDGVFVYRVSGNTAGCPGVA